MPRMPRQQSQTAKQSSYAATVAPAYAAATYDAPRASKLGCPGEFCGYLALNPMTERTLSKVAVLICSFCVARSQRTFSLQGGVVKEPE